MDYRKLGNTGLDISPLCLGCMTFGLPDRGNHEWTLDEDKSRPIIRRALELGERSMEEIARRCGYGSGDVLRKAFTRRMGVSPREYARRFAPDSELP